MNIQPQKGNATKTFYVDHTNTKSINPNNKNTHIEDQSLFPLLSPYKLGDLTLSNRMVMAPMTRSRAINGNLPHPTAAIYYTQRASAGLIITEATPVHPQGIGYIRTPGIYTHKQVAEWRKITDAVHQAGGKIFMQLWHVGRVSHPDFQGGQLPVAPSALQVEGEIFTLQGKKKILIPRALELYEIPSLIEYFKKGAENAKAAGFDGVEIHGANGYLLDQFLRDGSNQRTDAYGGSIQNRARLPLEVTQAVIDIFGTNRVGYRISPHGSMYSMSDSNPVETFSYLTQKLSELKLSYLHISEAINGPAAPPPSAQRLTPILRKKFRGTYIVNGGYDANSGNLIISQEEADLVAFGVPFLANPDLPERFKMNTLLNSPDYTTFYTGEEKGYIDYPTLE